MDSLIVDRHEDVTTIRLNRPDRMNALDLTLIRELTGVLRALGSDDGVRAVMLTGAGKAFSAGGDFAAIEALRQAPPVDSRRMLLEGLDVIRALWRLERPTLALVNGAAVGGGLSLALACDLVVAADSATLSFPFVRLGIVPDLAALWVVPRLVGIRRAKDLLMTGRTFTAREAADVGLITRAVPADALEGEGRALAAELAAGATRAVGATKALLQRGLELDLESFLDLEAHAQSLLWHTADHREGVAAFRERRPPRFTGR
jgi:2-(1,2-epoxy-1,2-dihydrophenyl)acetyl-CoA isomerase